MPFITKERRALMDKKQIPPEELEPGDICYTYYKPMVEAWRHEPRWSTANRLYEHVLSISFNREQAAAAQLAWQVFFQLYVMPYELGKRKENGDI